MTETKAEKTYTVIAKVTTDTESALKAEQGRMQTERRATVKMPEVVAAILNKWAMTQEMPA